MGKQFDTEAMQALYAAVGTFRQKLNEGCAILGNAANVCDQAMGSDQISKKQIAKLKEAADMMQRADRLAEAAGKALKRDYDEAIRIANM